MGSPGDDLTCHVKEITFCPLFTQVLDTLQTVIQGMQPLSIRLILKLKKKERGQGKITNDNQAPKSIDRVFCVDTTCG